MSKLRDFANGQGCVRCKQPKESVVGAHYTGFRRLDYGGGFGIKVEDWLIAELCAECHRYMDKQMRSDLMDDYSHLNPSDRHLVVRCLHSEEFLHLIALTLLRRAARGVVRVA